MTDSAPRSNLARAARCAALSLALANGALSAQQPPRRQPAPAPRTVPSDSGRTRAVATDTTRNRRAANQDSSALNGADTSGAPNGGRGADPYAGLRLRSIGPAMISGRIVDLAVHPRDRKIWYIGVAAGGVWKTTNAGTTWTPVFDNQSTYSIGAITIDSKNPNTVWVGTGENNAQRAVSYGDGVYRSTDGGRSWQNMGLRESEHIGKIVIDPRNSDIVYVAAQGPLSRAGGDRGLFKSSDGGRTWAKVLDAGKWAGVSDVVQDPRNPDVLIATSWQRIRRTYGYIAGGPESAVWRSTDGGATWRRSQAGLPNDAELGRVGLAMSPVNPDVVYAILEASNDRGGTFRSRDGGVSWEKMSNYNTVGLYYAELFADPVDVDRVYAVDVRNMVSEDGGRTFRPVGERNKHVDNHVIWIDPSDADHLLFGCDGGLYESFDRGQTYKYFANLPLGQFYRVDVDHNAPFYKVHGGTQDNGSVGGFARTRSNLGVTNSDWGVTGGGDGFVSKVDPKDPFTVYNESQHGNLQRVDLRTGESVSIVPQPEPGEDPLRWYWDSPVIISPHSNTRLYFAAQRLYRSDDRGGSWKALTPDLSRKIDRDRIKLMDRVWSIDAVARNTSSSFFGAIVSVAESPLKEGQLWIGTDDGTIQVSENGGQTWRRIESFPGVPDTTQVARVVPSSHDASTAYAAFDGHMSGDFRPYLLKSTDLGRSWTSIAGNLPNKGTVYAIIDDPVDPTLLFVGTEFGLYFTKNNGQTWTRLRGGLPTIQVRDLVMQKETNDLVVATFGRSFYVLDDVTPLRALTAKTLADESALFPVRRTPLYVPSNFVTPGSNGSQGSDVYTAPNPPYGAMFTYYLRSTIRSRREQRQLAERTAARQGRDIFPPSWDSLRVEDREEPPAIELTVSDAQGRVVRRITGPVQQGFQRVAWDLRLPGPTVTLAGRGGGAGNPPDDEEGGFGGRGGVGPFAPPGTYQVALAKRVDGVITPLGTPQRFEVYLLDADENAGRSAAIIAFQEQAAKLQRAMMGANSLAGELGSRVAALRRAIEETPAAPAQLSTDVRAIDADLRAIRELLDGDPTLNRRQEPTTPSLMGRMQVMTQGARSLEPPTATQRRQYDILSTEFASLLVRLRAIADTRLRAAETAAEQAGAPWTPGRIPEWKP
jgi:photosystem II stability/assembly factor-like uncharacterized protein